MTYWWFMKVGSIVLRVVPIGLSLGAVTVMAAAEEEQIPFAESQAGLNQRAADDFEKADQELNAVYRQVLKDYADDPLFIEKFKAAQRAWITLRDLELKASFPHEDEPMYYGSVYPMCSAYRKAELTKERTEYLRRYGKGTQEGDVCSGSLKIK
jgi:uncharacterized protein YecT (DUF1311 family)